MIRSLAIILGIALALRLGWTLSRPAPALASLPDQREYLELARNVIAGNGFVFHDERLDVNVLAFRTPGYPLFVAACGANVTGIRIVQSIIDASSVLAIFLMARRWLDPRASLLAAAIVALNPYLISFCALILSETLFIALLAWGVASLAHRRTTIGLFVLAVAVLVRPSAIALPTLFGFFTVIANEPTAIDWRRAVTTALCGTAMTSVVLFPWGFRNHRVIGAWVFTSTNSGFTFYDGFNPRATGASDQSFATGALHHELLAQPNELARSHLLSQRAWAFIRENPSRVVSLTLAKIARMWSPIPLSKEYGSDAKVVILSAAYTIPLFLLVVSGLWIAPIPRAVKALLILPAIYFTLVHAASVGSLRYRVPADVTMSVVAASVFAGRSRRMSNDQVSMTNQ